MGKYKALYVAGLFKGADYRVVKGSAFITSIIAATLILAFYLSKKGNSGYSRKDKLLVVSLAIVSIVSLGVCGKYNGAIEIIDTKSGKTTVVANSEVAEKVLDKMKAIDYRNELDKERDLAEDAVKELSEK